MQSAEIQKVRVQFKTVRVEFKTVHVWFKTVHAQFRKGLQRCAAGEAGVDVVPPLEFVAFAHLPAEQDHAAVAQRGEVDQAAFEILELYAQNLQLRDPAGQVSQSSCVNDARANSAAAFFRCFRRFFRLVAIARDVAMRLLNFSDNRTHARQKRIRFLNGEEFHLETLVFVSDPDELGGRMKLGGFLLVDLRL
jgi:hypothetical protein